MKTLISFIRGLFGMQTLELLPWREAGYAHIYYSAKGIFICAVHRDTRGMGPNGEPMVLLPMSASTRDIGNALLASLKGSRDGLSVEESDSQTSRAFALIGEHDWDAFEKSWHLTSACLEKDLATVVLYTMHRYETGGYVSFKGDPIYRCNAEPEEVGRTVRQIIDTPPLEMVPHEPSHT